MTFWKIHHIIGVLIVIFSVFQPYEIRHIHKEFGSSARAAEHARYNKHHVYESAAERLEVCGRSGISADTFGTAYQPRIHGDARTIVCKTRFIVLIYKMVLEKIKITVGKLFAIHFLYLITEQTTIQTDEIGFWKLADKSGYVLVLHICVGIVFWTRGGIGSFAIINKKLQLVANLTVFEMFLTVKHERFRSLVMILTHKGDFNLVLNVLNTHSVAKTKVVHYALNVFGVNMFAYRFKSF